MHSTCYLQNTANIYSGHYDLLYKNEDVAQVPAAVPEPLNVPAYQAAYPSTLFAENESFGADAFAGMPFASLANHDQGMFGASLMPALNYQSMVVPSVPLVSAAYPSINAFEPTHQQEAVEYGMPSSSSQTAISSAAQMHQSRDVFRPSMHMFDELVLQQTPVAAQDQEFQSAQFRK